MGAWPQAERAFGSEPKSSPAINPVVRTRPDLADPIVVPARIDPRGDKSYAVFSVNNATGTLRATGNATLRDRAGEVTDSYGGSFGTPAAVVLGARYNAVPFDHAEIDVLGTVGVNSALAAADQQKLIDWAAAKWGV